MIHPDGTITTHLGKGPDPYERIKELETQLRECQEQAAAFFERGTRQIEEMADEIARLKRRSSDSCPNPPKMLI